MKSIEKEGVEGLNFIGKKSGKKFRFESQDDKL